MSRRPYHSPRRQAAALATRQAVLEAAERVFVSRGYGGTTLSSVAEKAGVSLATVKLIAPTKATLLVEAFRARVRGDAGEAVSSERPSWQAMLATSDAQELVQEWVRLTSQAHQRSAALYEVVAQASGGEAELAAVESRGSAGRRESYRAVIEALAAKRRLRPGLDLEGAVDIAWVLNSPQGYRLFTRCGWTAERWETWLTETMIEQLLTDRPG